MPRVRFSLSNLNQNEQRQQLPGSVSVYSWKPTIKTSADPQTTFVSDAESLVPDNNNNNKNEEAQASKPPFKTSMKNTSETDQQRSPWHDKGAECTYLKHFYEEDELCRKNFYSGNLEFGIVSRYLNDSKKKLKIFWTLTDGIEEQDLDVKRPELYDQLRLVDRKVDRGDIIHSGEKRGEVLDVTWTCHVRIQESGMNILDVPCSRLEPLLPYYRGQTLEFNGWIGTVTKVSSTATLLFSKGRKAKVSCSELPDDFIYSGRKVKYTHKQFTKAGLTELEGRPFSKVFRNEDPVEAFVLFVNVQNVDVTWNGRVSFSNGTCDTSLSGETPPTTLSRSKLKYDVKILGELKDVDWENCLEAVDSLYNCSVQPTDVVVPKIENYMIKKYFEQDDEAESRSGIRFVKDSPSTIMTNVSHVVRVLRLCRLVKVKWSNSGKVETIRASDVTSRHTFKKPPHQLVHKKAILEPYSYDTYGLTLSRDTNEMVLVQWYSRDSHLASQLKNNGGALGGSLSQSSIARQMSSFPKQGLDLVSSHDIEPHFAYGKLAPNDIVYRATHCRLPEELFTVGWIRSITQKGQLVVVSMHSNQEHFVFPSEVERTGVKIHVNNNDEFDSNQNSPQETSLIALHGLRTLLAADKLFAKNLKSGLNWAGVVIPDLDHFTLLSTAPEDHAFYGSTIVIKGESLSWKNAVRKDKLYLVKQVNEDFGTLWIKGYKDRSDLYSVLMAAPSGTPYEGGLFAFDIQLPAKYPYSPPSVFLTTVLSFEDSSNKLCPGIQSLELWENSGPTTKTYSLVQSLQVLQSNVFSMESLVPPSSASSLVRRWRLQRDISMSRTTNAQIIVDVLDLMFRQVMDPPKLWTTEVINYFHMTFVRTKCRLERLIRARTDKVIVDTDQLYPPFPLMPLSDGFIVAIKGRLKRFEQLTNPLKLDRKV